MKPIFFIFFILLNIAASAQKYEKFNIQNIRFTNVRDAQCYDTTTGYYDCLEIGVVILIKRKSGNIGSISTTLPFNGQISQEIRREFGNKSKIALKSLVGKLDDIDLLKLEIEKLNPQLKKQFLSLLEIGRNFTFDEGYDEEKWINYKSTLNTIQYSSLDYANQDLSIAERISQLKKNTSISQTVVELFHQGLDVSTGLIPFINDARDYYELTTGKDLITGEEIGYFGRVLSAIGIIGGSGYILRNSLDKLKNYLPKRIFKETSKGIPGLTFNKNGNWISTENIIYRRHSKVLGKENRLRHIFKHSANYPHTVEGKSLFKKDISIKELPILIDEAWKKRTQPIVNKNGFDEYTIDLGKQIGTKKGQNNIKIIMEKGTTNIITAYPSKPKKP